MKSPATVMMNVLGADSRGSAQGIGEGASSAVLDSAFAWLCERRIDYADSAGVWNVRRRWPDLKLQLQDLLLRGQSRFLPLRRIHVHGEFIELWAALDALVLKARLYWAGGSISREAVTICRAKTARNVGPRP